MAERFGGKYSPQGSQLSGQPTGQPTGQPSAPPPRNAFDGKRPTRAGGKSNILFFAPLIFAVRAFQGTPTQMVLGLGATALILLAAWLTREGIFAQEAYEARKVARRPAFPRKIVASALIGAGLVSAGLMAAQPVLMSALFGIVGATLHLFAFGPDPLRDKGMAGIDSFQSDRVARAVDEGEAYLTAMKDAILRARDRSLETRVDTFATTARTLFRTVESDPRDLTAARKYLSVYLQGARDATVKFADIYAQNRDTTARSDYEALLGDLETTFASRTTALLANDHSDLDVEISVLRDRLKYET